MKPILWAIAMIGVGVGGLWGLGWLWLNHPEAAVMTIMPMVGTPYIIFVAAILAGIQGLCIELWERIAPHQETK